MLNLEGSKIVGNKGFAVVNKNSISWWAKKSRGVPEMVDYLNKVAEER